MTVTIREVAAFEDTVNLVSPENPDEAVAPRGHLVRPAYVLVNRGEKVKWVNCTNDGLKLRVTGLGIEKESGPTQNLEIDIAIDANPGVYDYDLTTSTTKKPFKGESKPEIIVK